MYYAPRPAQPVDVPAPYVLGCMNFGRRTAAPEAQRIIERAIEAGIGLFDTANAYNDGESERIVGAATRGRAHIATKVGFAKGDNLAPETILAACDHSLKRLDVDSIDLYYLHVPDPNTPIEASLSALATLLENGKIQRWGVSNYASWQILEMRQLAAAAGMPGPVVAQQLYNPLIRQLDIEFFKFTARFPIHTTVYNPLAGGLLARPPVSPGDAPPAKSRFTNPLYRRRYWRNAQFAATEDLRAVATEERMSLLELAYAFVIHRPGVDSVLVGPGSVAQLNEALAARERRLSDGALIRMDAIYHELIGTDASYAR